MTVTFCSNTQFFTAATEAFGVWGLAVQLIGSRRWCLWEYTNTGDTATNGVILSSVPDFVRFEM